MVESELQVVDYAVRTVSPSALATISVFPVKKLSTFTDVPPVTRAIARTNATVFFHVFRFILVSS